MGSVTIICESCGGHGRTSLAPVHQAVWELLSDKEYCQTADILKRLPGVKQTALCNRLRWMERRGLVLRERDLGDSRVTLWRRKAGV